MTRSATSYQGRLIQPQIDLGTIGYPAQTGIGNDRSPTVIDTASAVTYSVAQLRTGRIERDCAGAGRSDVTPDADEILAIAGFGLARDFDTATACLVVNTSDAAESITITGGTDVAVVGAAVIAQGEARVLTFVRTSSTTVTCQVSAVTGFTGSITGDVNVTGNVTASATVTGADLVASDDLTVGDDATIGGDLAVTGATSLTSLTYTGVEKAAPSATPANITTAGAGSYSAANVAVGIITRDCNGASRTDTIAAATDLITALGLSANYQERYCWIVNTSIAAETITLAGDTGTTIKGSITIAQNQSTRIAIQRTGAAAVCVREV